MAHWYLSGPISGKPKGNIMAFEQAAREIRQHGWNVVSPVELDAQEQISTEEVESGSKEWRLLLARDIEIVAGSECRGVIVLEGWEESRGARLEVHVALEFGKPVVTWPGRESVKRVPLPAELKPQFFIGGPQVRGEWSKGFARWANQQRHEPRRHPTSERFHEILKELGATHDKKSQDYGRDTDPLANVRASSEWGLPSWVGAMVRATDKVRRLQTFASKGTLANESARDAFIDLAVYAVIGLVLFEEEND